MAGDPEGGETGDGVTVEAAVADALLLLSVPGLLALVHFLAPPTVQESLALDHGALRPHAFLTAAYVHASNAHLLGNVVSYLLSASYAYALCLAAGRRRWFRRALALLLVALPVLVNAATVALFAALFPRFEPIVRGFSGVAAGFAGFLLVALGVFLRTRFSAPVGWTAGALVLLGLLLEVDYIYAGTFRPVTAGLAVVGSTLLVGALLRRRTAAVPSLRRRAVLADAGAAVVVSVVLAYLVASMFPADVVRHGRFTNVFAHGLGFLGGGLLAMAALRWRRR